jgi:hypothetical protein
LRIADALDRRHKQVVTDLRCRVMDGRVSFYVAPTADPNESCELEMWSAERKSDWFRAIFKTATDFSAESRVESVPGRGNETRNIAKLSLGD